ncbi:MAG: hypothetical protein NT159_02845 [Proteobacteria bacterium]|nr:hypothetical protein [Pseudomonadota bacterium]
MSKLTAALMATLLATGAMVGTPAWADRGNANFDHRNGNFDRGDDRYDRGRGHGYSRGYSRGYGHGDNAWGWGLGLLAGSAILLAASEPRRVFVSAPVSVYAPPAPPLAVYAQPSVQWWYYCSASASYFPYVNYCPSGWTRVPAMPPR